MNGHKMTPGNDVEAMFAEVQMLRKRLARVTLLAGLDTLDIDGTRWVEADRVFAAATGNDEEVAGDE